MEIRTCEEFVLAELERLQKENEKLKEEIIGLKLDLMKKDYNGDKIWKNLEITCLE